MCNACALRFIRCVKSDELPSICSANTNIAALLDANAPCFNNCLIVYVLPLINGKVVNPGMRDILAYRPETFTSSVNLILPLSMSSNTK